MRSTNHQVFPICFEINFDHPAQSLIDDFFPIVFPNKVCRFVFFELVYLGQLICLRKNVNVPNLIYANKITAWDYIFYQLSVESSTDYLLEIQSLRMKHILANNKLNEQRS